MIRVTCAIIRNDEDEVLVVQRGEKTDHPFKWEFPGGKVKKGETEEECIIREIREELSMEIVICSKMQEVKHDYGHKQITLVPFICDTLDEIPLLAEHNAYKWVSVNDLKTINFSEADIYVAEEYLTLNISNTDRHDDPDRDELTSKVDEDLMAMITGIMSTKEVDWVANSAIKNPAIFRKLIEYSYREETKLAFRSSWTLTKVCDKYPELIYPHLTRVVESLDKIDNESVRRSFLRIISLIDMNRLSPRQHGIMADHCFGALKSGFSAIAIKAYSMEILYKLALLYPDLLNELSATIQLLQGEGSAGIIARGHIILKKLGERSFDNNPGLG